MIRRKDVERGRMLKEEGEGRKGVDEGMRRRKAVEGKK
jgi:hypothetical protein